MFVPVVGAQPDTAGAGGSLLASVTTLHLFCKVHPALLVRHATTLQPYLSIKCTVSYHTHTHTHTHTQARTHARTHTQTDTHKHARTHTHTQTVHAMLHTYIHSAYACCCAIATRYICTYCMCVCVCVCNSANMVLAPLASLLPVYVG